MQMTSKAERIYESLARPTPVPSASDRLHALDAYVSEFLAETRDAVEAGRSVGERDLARYMEAAGLLAASAFQLIYGQTSCGGAA